jgi:hypothetical protein
MTQPVPVDPAPQARPTPPYVTHVVEHTEQHLRVVEDNGQKAVTVEKKAVTWALGKPMPGDQHSKIVAIFKDDAGGARIWVQLEPGHLMFDSGVAFLAELPAQAVRFMMKTLPAANLRAEIEADTRAFLYGEADDDEGDESGDDPGGEPAEGSLNGGAPAAIGQG